jgi:hypothetical protein
MKFFMQRKLLSIVGSVPVILTVIALALFVMGTVPPPTQSQMSSFSTSLSEQVEVGKDWAESWSLPQLFTALSIIAGAVGFVVTVVLKFRTLHSQIAGLKTPVTAPAVKVETVSTPLPDPAQDRAAKAMNRVVAAQALEAEELNLLQAQEDFDNAKAALKKSRASVLTADEAVGTAEGDLIRRRSEAAKAVAESEAALSKRNAALAEAQAARLAAEAEVTALLARKAELEATIAALRSQAQG